MNFDDFDTEEYLDDSEEYEDDSEEYEEDSEEEDLDDAMEEEWGDGIEEDWNDNEEVDDSDVSITLETLDQFDNQPEVVTEWIKRVYTELWGNFESSLTGDIAWATAYNIEAFAACKNPSVVEKLTMFGVYLFNLVKATEKASFFVDNTFYNVAYKMSDEVTFNSSEASSLTASIRTNLYLYEDNRGTMDDKGKTVTCGKCGGTVSLQAFKEEAELVHSCGARIDRHGNVIKEQSKVTCPVCNKTYVPSKAKEGDDNLMCPDCKASVNSCKEFRSKITAFIKKANDEGVDTYLGDLFGTEDGGTVATTFNNRVISVAENLLKVYEFYRDTLDPVAGVLTTNIKGACIARYKPDNKCIKPVTNSELGLSFFDLWEIIKSGLCKDNGKYVNPNELERHPSAILGSHNKGSLAEFCSCYQFSKGSRNPFMASAFHLPHIMGYYLPDTNVYTKIKRGATESFEKHVLESVKDAFWECLFNSRDYRINNKYTVETAIIALFKDLDANADRALLNDLYRGLSNFMGNFLSDLSERLTNLIVFRACDSASINIEMWLHSDETADNRGNVSDTSMSSVIGNTFYRELTSQSQSLDKRTLSDRLFGTGARTQEVVSNGWTEQATKIGANMLKMYSFIVVMDSDRFLAYPLFAYKPMSKLAELGKLSAKQTLVGQKLNGTYTYINDVMSLGGISLFATSRAGKGVMTLAMLGTFFATGSPIMYFDAKPEMSGTLLTMGYLYTQRLKKLDVDKTIRFPAYEFKTTIANADSNKFYSDLKKKDPEAFKIMQKDQSYWLKNLSSAEIKAVWKDRYGVQLPYGDSLTALLYYRAAQFGQCVKTIARLCNIEMNRPIIIMDELNRAFGGAPITGKVANTAMLEWVAESARQYNEGIEDFKGQKTGATKEEKVEADKNIRGVAKQRAAFIKWLGRMFVGMSGKGGLDNAVLDMSGSMFYRSLSNRAKAMDGTEPLVLGIGQTRSIFERSADCPIKFILDRCNVKLQGNWSDGDNNSTVQAVENTLEAKAKYIHPYSGGNVSGFFAMDNAGTIDVFRSYLVLNDNNDSYIEGDKNTLRGRVHTALGSPSGNASRNIDHTLNEMLCRNYNRTTIASDKKLAPLSELLKDYNKLEREPGVGFTGYIDMLGGLNSDIDTKGADALTPEEQEKMKAYLLNLAKGYEVLTQVFLNTAVAKHFKYSCMEEYFYDLHPDSFLPDDMLIMTDLSEFETKLAEMNGVSREEMGESMEDVGVEDEGSWEDTEATEDSEGVWEETSFDVEETKSRIVKAIASMDKLIKAMTTSFERYKTSDKNIQEQALAVIQKLANTVLNIVRADPPINLGSEELKQALPNECSELMNRLERYKQINAEYVKYRK